jgi:hypothetical protein
MRHIVPAKLITFGDDGEALQKDIRLQARLCSNENPKCVEI